MKDFVLVLICAILLALFISRDQFNEPKSIDAWDELTIDNCVIDFDGVR